MAVEIINCEQGSEEWIRARMGIPTASMFDQILAKGRGGASSDARTTYLHKLAGEIITGEPMESFSTAHTRRGHAWEDEARAHYAFIKGVQPERVGFMRNGDAGASMDRLVGKVGGLEIKTKLPHLVIAQILAGDEFPAEHLAQCQGQLMVSEREWVDLSIYWRKTPPIIVRTYRNEAYIADLKFRVRLFNEELAAIVDQVRRYGQPAKAA